jgi:Family of unknown function (DUF5824)
MTDRPIDNKTSASLRINDAFKDKFKNKKGVKKPDVTFYQSFDEERINESQIYKSLIKKSEKHAIDISILGEVYNRGLDSWLEEYNLTPQQYAFSRVNSYVSKGKSYYNEDSDIVSLDEAKETRKLHFGVALSKGMWGKEKFKHIIWSIDHPNDIRRKQPDGIGNNKMESSKVSQMINSHPEIKKHLKDGWRYSEGTGIASLKKNDILSNLKNHAQGKMDRYGHYRLQEEVNLDESFSLDTSDKIIKDKRHISNFLEDVRSADYVMTKMRLPTGKWVWRKLRRSIKVAVPEDPDTDKFIPYQNQN